MIFLKEERIAIQTEFIRLDQLLKFAAVCSSGGEAKELIVSGGVLVNGEACAMRGKKIRPGDDVCFQNQHYTVAYAD